MAEDLLGLSTDRGFTGTIYRQRIYWDYLQTEDWFWDAVEER